MLLVNQLNGFGVGGSDVAALASITHFASATSTGSTINFPASIIAGDLIVMVDKAATSFGTPASVTPSGFTSINEQTGNDSTGFIGYRQHLTYKLALGTETGSLTGMNGSATNAKAMHVFRGDIAATLITVSTPNGQLTTGNPTAQSVNASGGTPPLVVIGAYGAAAAVSPRTFSTTADGEANPDTTLYLAYKIYNSAPANTSIDMDDEGNINILQSCWIEMA